MKNSAPQKLIKRPLKIFIGLVNTGIYFAMPPRKRIYVQMTNCLNLFYIFIISIPVIWVFINLTDYGFNAYVRFYVLIVVAVINIYLNSLYRHFAAKILTVVAPFFCIFILPMVTNFVHAGMFIWFPYGIIVVGAFSFFILSLDDKAEKTVLLVMIPFFAVTALCCKDLLKNFIDKSVDISFIEENQLFYTTSQVIMVIFLYCSFYFFKLIYYRQQMQLKKLNNVLDDKIIELSYLRGNLERIVNERTEKLNVQNERIRELAHTNSHGIRAYVVRILGLSRLFNLDITEEEKEFCKKEILENAIGLDNLTRRLSKQLVEEN